MSRHSNIYQVYIADGFADDCEELIDRCARVENLNYQTFCNIWKDMKFAYMFQGRSSGAEIAELSEEVLQIAKPYMLANTNNFEESVAGLFLVYALLNLQPYSGFAALRLVPEDVDAINRIEVVARREKRYDVLYILGSVLVKGPSQYHAEQRERGLELPLRKYLEGYTSIDVQGVRAKGVLYRQNEELDVIRELNCLSRHYATAKMVIGGQSDPSLRYSNDNLASELDASLKKVINGIIDVNREGDSSPEHPSSAQEIKERAMRNKVDSMKHLTGFEDRQSIGTSPKKKLDLKSKAGKVKSGSPTKPLATGSPKKRKISCRNSPNKKAPSKTDVAESEAKAQTNQETDEQHQELCIDSLPVLIRADDDKYIQIQVVEEKEKDKSVQKKGKSKGNARSNSKKTQEVSNKETHGASSSGTAKDLVDTSDVTKDDGSMGETTEAPKLKKPHKRDLKKSSMKSKFKRMGILPVANFKDA